MECRKQNEPDTGHYSLAHDQRPSLAVVLGAGNQGTVRATSSPFTANCFASFAVMAAASAFFSSASLNLAPFRSSSPRPRTPVVLTTWPVPARPVATPATPAISAAAL